MKHRALWWALAAAMALALLCGCGGPGTGSAAQPQATQEPSPPPEETLGQPDDWAGEYVNDYLQERLTLDGYGGCRLQGPDWAMEGTYTCAQDGTLTLALDGEVMSAVRDQDGDVTIQGRQGYYLCDLDFWGLSELQAAPAGAGLARFRDFDKAVGVTLCAGLRLVQDGPADALTVTDGSGGYAVGRNETAAFLRWDGEATAFLEDYIREKVFQDYAALYGPPAGYEALRLFAGDVPGRLAAGTLRLDGDRAVEVQAVLYTSTYADGTVNYLCKTLFAPAGEEQLATLRSGVTDMGAVRLRAE